LARLQELEDFLQSKKLEEVEKLVFSVFVIVVAKHVGEGKHCNDVKEKPSSKQYLIQFFLTKSNYRLFS
jgi:hypothetical protein